MDLDNLINSSEKELIKEFENIDKIEYLNSKKVLNALWNNKVSEQVFNSTTGYGYDDLGRDVIEKVLTIEKEMNNNLMEGKYLTKGRAISSHLSVPENEEFKLNILKGELTPEKLIKMENNEMISSKEKNNIQKIKDNVFESKRSDWNKEHTKVKEGMYTCYKCKGKRTTTQEIQMRSADEPMTLFVTCVDCGHNWTIK